MFPDGLTSNEILYKRNLERNFEKKTEKNCDISGKGSTREQNSVSSLLRKNFKEQLQ